MTSTLLRDVAYVNQLRRISAFLLTVRGGASVPEKKESARKQILRTNRNPRYKSLWREGWLK